LKVEPLVADAAVDCFAADPLAALALALAETASVDTGGRSLGNCEVSRVDEGCKVLGVAMEIVGICRHIDCPFIWGSTLGQIDRWVDSDDVSGGGRNKINLERTGNATGRPGEHDSGAGCCLSHWRLDLDPAWSDT
jgi:hypothetical protein